MKNLFQNFKYRWRTLMRSSKIWTGKLRHLRNIQRNTDYLRMIPLFCQIAVHNSAKSHGKRNISILIDLPVIQVVRWRSSTPIFLSPFCRIGIEGIRARPEIRQEQYYYFLFPILSIKQFYNKLYLLCIQLIKPLTFFDDVLRAVTGFTNVKFPNI